MNLLFWRKSAPKADNRAIPYYLNYTGRRTSFELFNDSFKEWSGACISIRANAVASLEWKFYKNGEELTDHWVIDLFKKPNAHFSMRDFFESIVKYLDSTGNCVIHTIKNSSGLPAAMYVLPTNAVTPVFENGVLVRYKTTDKNEKILGLDDVIYLRNFEPAHTFPEMFGGKSLVSKAEESIKSSVLLSGFMQRFFDSDGVPPLVLTSPEMSDADKQQKMRELWNANNPNYKLLAVLAGGTITPMAGTASAATNSNLIETFDKILKENIGATFGVPSAMITGTSANYATAQQTDYGFRVNTVEPLAYRIEDQLTNFFQQFDESIEIKHVEFIASDPELEMKQTEFRLSNGLSTINDERALAGLPPVPDGDTILIKSGLMPLNQVLNPPTPDVKKNYKIKSLNLNTSYSSLPESERILVWKKWDTIAQNSVGLIGSGWKKMIDEIEEEVLGNIDSVEEKSLVLKWGKTSDFSDIFNAKKWYGRLRTMFDKVMTGLIIENMKEAFSSIGENWNQVESPMDTQVSSALDNSINKIKVSVDKVSEEMKETIRRTINDNKNANEAELKRVLKETLKDTFKGAASRAEMIAQTTATYARGASQEVAWEPYGDTIIKTWVCERDSRVRDSHRAADGSHPDEEGYFHVGGDIMKFPAAGSKADENVRCRCTVVAELKD